MNSETPSTSIHAQQASINPAASITPDRSMRPQDQRNSRDVVLKSLGSGNLKPAAGTGSGAPRRLLPGAAAAPDSLAA